MSMRKVRWECLHGCPGVLGPSRPRKDDVCRYCLPCSARTGRLVLRAAPALERVREKKIEKRHERKIAKVAKEREQTAAYYTVEGVNLHDEMLAMLRVDAFKRIRKNPPKLQIRRAKRPQQRWGVAWSWKNKIQIADFPGVSAETVRETLIHELAHIAAPGAGHSVRWKTVYRLACEQYFGIRPRVENRICGDVSRKLAAAASESKPDPLYACEPNEAQS